MHRPVHWLRYVYLYAYRGTVMILVTKLMVGASVAASLALGSLSVPNPETDSTAGTAARSESADSQDVALLRTVPCAVGCDFWTHLPSR